MWLTLLLYPGCESFGGRRTRGSEGQRNLRNIILIFRYRFDSQLNQLLKVMNKSAGAVNSFAYSFPSIITNKYTQNGITYQA